MNNDLTNRELNINQTEYISYIEFHRVSFIKMNEFKILIKKNDSLAIGTFLEELEYHNEKAYKTLVRYPFLKDNSYFHLKNVSFHNYHGLLGTLLNNQKDFFPKKKLSLLELNQLNLFSDKISKLNMQEEIDLPIIALIGQTKNHLHDNFKWVNYLDYKNIERIDKMLTKSQLTNLDKFIPELKKISTREYRSFLNEYSRINEKIAKNENIEDDIWAIGNDEWNDFLKEINEFNGFFNNFKLLKDFFRQCIKFNKDFVIIKHYYD